MQPHRKRIREKLHCEEMKNRRLAAFDSSNSDCSLSSIDDDNSEDTDGGGDDDESDYDEELNQGLVRQQWTVLSVASPIASAANRRSVSLPTTGSNKLGQRHMRRCNNNAMDASQANPSRNNPSTDASAMNSESIFEDVDLDEASSHSNRSLKPADLVLGGGPKIMKHKAGQLLVGSLGIYASFLYYGLVQEDLYRYQGPTGERFNLVWSHQVLESILAAMIGYVGRTWLTSTTNSNAQTGGGGGSPTTASTTTTTTALPIAPYLQMGVTQLAAKSLISMSLEAGVSYPVLTIAKSAKIVPVMLGQLVLGGSSYSMRDYLFAILIVAGTALLSAGGNSNTTTNNETASTEATNTIPGLLLIFLSLTADGFTGGLQKKLQRVSTPTTYDLMYFSHLAQLATALTVSVVVGEIWRVSDYLAANPTALWLVLVSSLCSAVGQCFVFYVISCFDPLVCTTITTTRKMFTVLLSISYKGHALTQVGCLGLGLACVALLVEIEGKITSYRANRNGNSPTVKPLQQPSQSHQQRLPRFSWFPSR